MFLEKIFNGFMLFYSSLSIFLFFSICMLRSLCCVYSTKCCMLGTGIEIMISRAIKFIINWLQDGEVGLLCCPDSMLGNSSYVCFYFICLLICYRISVGSDPTASIPLWSSFFGEKSFTDCTLDSWEVWKASLPHWQWWWETSSSPSNG